MYSSEALDFALRRLAELKALPEEEKKVLRELYERKLNECGLNEMPTTSECISLSLKDEFGIPRFDCNEQHSGCAKSKQDCVPDGCAWRKSVS